MGDYTSFQCSAVDLLCTEETNGFYFLDDVCGEPSDHRKYQTPGEQEAIFGNGGSGSGSGLGSFIHFPNLSEECFAWMLEREKEHLPAEDYVSRLGNGDLDVRFRKDALDWMLKACSYFNFGELSLHAAISFFDRFVSTYGLPVSSPLGTGNKNWAVQLVAVSCLSLAAKIEEVYVPPVEDLQIGDPEYLFEAKIVQKMEMVILHNLNWKIKAYTPCNFIDYYLRKMNDVEFPPSDLINKSIQVITSTIKGIDFLKFKPSEIAAAVAIYVSGEMQAMDIDKALSGFVGVEKRRVVKCLELIQNLPPLSGNTAVSTTTTTNATTGSSIVLSGLPLRGHPIKIVLSGSNSSSMTHSPNGVLDASSFISCKSNERIVGSCSSSPHTSQENKRRRLDQTIGGDCGGFS